MFDLFNDRKQKYQNIIKTFFQKMDFSETIIDINFKEEQDNNLQEILIINIDVKTQEPQILIGQDGQNLLAIQKLLKMIFIKKYQHNIKIELDINDYKNKKLEYVKKIAQEAASWVVKHKEKKFLTNMSPFERRIIHQELSLRGDVVTESQGEKEARYIVISPK